MKKICYAGALMLLFTFAWGMSAFANSPYISKVYDFKPAPGQFINELPAYSDGDTQQQLNAKCEEYLVGKASGSIVCLGAYGGYIVFGFDHPVLNVADTYDFKIYGNAFAGSAEPGIVMVSHDDNGNGLPDDKWYELAGSDYSNPKTLHDYTITYYKPTGEEPDSAYIRWTSSELTEDGSGYITRNIFHKQSYWPGWIDGETISFTGTRLPKNAYTENGKIVLGAFEWGYADNDPNATDPGFKIEWAVDENGNNVRLPQIHFVKVYTGINQTCGTLGETSTEIMGAEDLHPDAGAVTTTMSESLLRIVDCRKGILTIENDGAPVDAIVYDMQGRILDSFIVSQGLHTCNLQHLPAGVYVMRCGTLTLKFII